MSCVVVVIFWVGMNFRPPFGESVAGRVVMEGEFGDLWEVRSRVSIGENVLGIKMSGEGRRE